MDNPVIQSRRRFDDTALNISQRGARLAMAEGAALRKAGCELFHRASQAAQEQESKALPDPYEQGLAEGERRAARLHTDTIAAMEKSLSVLQTHFSQSLAQIQDEQAKILIDVLEAALPALTRQSFFKDVSSMIKALESSKINSPITVHCAPEDVEPLSQLFLNGSKSEQFKLGTTSLSSNDVRFEWTDGGADIDYRQSAAAAMRSLVAHYKPQASGPSSSEPPSQTETESQPL